MKSKICSCCHEEKGVDLFPKNKRYKDGIYCWCKRCSNKRSYRCRDKEKALEVAKKYRESEKGKISQLKGRKSQAALEGAKRYRDKIVALGVYAERRRLRDRNDPHFKLRGRISSRIREMLKQQGTKKTNKTLELLGCSLEELKIHLESQFEDWMTWDNHGSYQKDRKTWHIDHIRPCSSFDLTDIEQQKICFHYTNLQPLLAIDNIKKSNKTK